MGTASNGDWVFWLLAAVLGVLGVVTLYFALLHDRSRGRRLAFSSRRLLAVFFSVALAVGACDSSELPNGYSVFWANGREVYIVNSSGLIIMGPSVSRYSVQGEVVVGELEDLESVSRTTYFVINTKTGRLHSFTNEQDWSDALLTNYRMSLESIEAWRTVYAPAPKPK